jgi:predicted AAA+ superfamily ATPase
VNGLSSFKANVILKNQHEMLIYQGEYVMLSPSMGGWMVDRAADRREIKKLLRQFPVTALIGPRQCGKTTMAREFAARHYFDLENPRDLAALQNPQLALEDLSGLIVIDEVQRRPDIFSLIRYLVDTRPAQKYLILGSASGHLLRQSSESLAGRIAFHILGGLRLQDVGGKHFKKLWLRGGFPRSFTATSEAQSQSWRDHYLTAFLERDLPQLGINIPAQAWRRFLTMLAHYHGQVLNYRELSSSFGISDMTARRHIEILESTFIVRLLPPWHANLGKRLVKRPKLYLSDSGMLHSLLGIEGNNSLITHPKIGASWEGFAMECMLRSINKSVRETYFWATHAGAELDLCWQHGGKNWGVEFKYGDAPGMTTSMKIAVNDLSLERLWVIYPGNKSYSLGNRIHVIPIGEIPVAWQY